MLHSIFDKTDKGREEIATRKHQLPLRMRGLLVQVDGKHNGAELIDKAAVLGLNDQSLTELLEGGYIQIVAPSSESESPAMADDALPLSEAPLGSAEAVRNAELRYRLIVDFYTETIKSQLGLRGYPLQLKVERAASIDDLRELRAAYLEAVFIAKGEDLARSLRDRLDLLLYHDGPV
jgi:hypothetical protein